MNATSIVRPWLLAAPLFLLALNAVLPGDAEAAAKATRKATAPKKTPAATPTPNVPANKGALAKTAKKHHKHHHKHHKKHHHKHHKKTNSRASNGGSMNQVNQDLARLQRDEKALDRDTSRLRRSLK